MIAACSLSPILLMECERTSPLNDGIDQRLAAYLVRANLVSIPEAVTYTNDNSAFVNQASDDVRESVRRGSK
jgi:hypothetical protein